MTHTVRDAAWQSAVVVRVPSLDETIAALRERFDLPRKPNGIPPHITAIVPFLPAADLTEAGALPALRSLCAAFEPFQVTFAATARFPNVLYLVPEPAEPFIALTRAIVDRWPLIRPYAGEHKAVVPHLTVTTSRRRELFGSVSEALEPQLPLSATVDGAHVYLFGGRRWTEHAALPFGSSS
ncbi:MAG TPA: 2'-5' RNA ligase family protein [Solirubrobacteraceae bacterium]|nr:2'-5' RNA ligase family protein [Solirubrobacteraceae bacterium]